MSKLARNAFFLGGGGVWVGTLATNILKPPKDSELAPWTWQFFVSEPGKKEGSWKRL